MRDSDKQKRETEVETVMNTKHLQYLVEVQKCGSINKAAKKCFITQSHLSRIVQNIEKEVGFDIFTRIGNSLEVTQGGMMFFESIEKIVRDCLAIENIPQYLMPKDNLSIASSPSSFLTQCYLDFSNAFPIENAKDVYREAGLKQLMELISGRAARLGYLVMSIPSYEKYQKLADPYNLKLTTIRKNLIFHAVMHKAHPLAGKAFVSIKDVASYPVVVDVDVDFEDTLKWMQLGKNHQVLSVSSRGTLIDALMGGRYLTTQIKADEDDIKKFGLVQKPISDLSSYMMICMIKPQYVDLSEREENYVVYTNKRINSFFENTVECRA